MPVNALVVLLMDDSESRFRFFSFLKLLFEDTVVESDTFPESCITVHARALYCSNSSEQRQVPLAVEVILMLLLGQQIWSGVGSAYVCRICSRCYIILPNDIRKEDYAYTHTYCVFDVAILLDGEHPECQNA